MEANYLSPGWQASSVHTANNGRPVELTYDRGHLLNFNGKEYELRRFYFHSPSEHHFDQRQYPLEVHFVHTATNPHLPET